MNAIAAIYDEKPLTYFAAAREDIVAALPTDSAAAILEIGCGTGSTGALALRCGKAARYVGIELDPVAAASAQLGLSEVLVGDVCAMDITKFEGQFDAVIASEVLEHLIDPWTVVDKLAACLKPGGKFYASSPNAAHWKIVANLIRNRFDYHYEGVMDRTHLRWFTPRTFRLMFEDAGMVVESTGSLGRLGSLTTLVGALTFGRLAHMTMRQIMLVARRP